MNNSVNKQKTNFFIRRFWSLVLLLVIGWAGLSVYKNATGIEDRHPFKLGLDLAGGSHLVYEADTSKIDPKDIPELMGVLREVIERRVNIFGVSEPLVQVEQSSFVTDEPKQRLIVELPGVTDVKEAIKSIGETPLLEFKLFLDNENSFDVSLLDSLETATNTSDKTKDKNGETNATSSTEGGNSGNFVDTGLTGRYLQSAQVQFASGYGGNASGEPLVAVTFSGEGKDLFEKITRDNVGKRLGIFLDGKMLSAPVINEPIAGGTAVISGSFTPEEAKELSKNLSFGALPMPIKLQSTQTIGSTLGEGVLRDGVKAGIIGLLLVIIFMISWYRLPGLMSGIALISYIIIMLFLFQVIPVTLTAAGLAGLILSLGMAVDANVLVFERMKEEYASGLPSDESIRIGFGRAWSAIRDGNITSILSAIILFWFGTSLVKGFALVFGLGVLVSMFSALVITKTLLMSLPITKKSNKRWLSFLFGSGFIK